MRISCSTACLHGRPLAEALAVIADAGFTAVDLVWPQVVSVTGTDPPSCGELRSMLAAARLEPAALIVPGSVLARAEDSFDAMQTVMWQLSVACEFGLSTLCVGAGDRHLQSEAQFVCELRDILPTVADAQMSIALLNREGSRLEQLADLRQVFLAVNSPSLRLGLDGGEFHRACVNPRDALREFEYRLGRLFIADMVGDQPVPFGDGEINLPALIQHARRIGYDDDYVVSTELADPDRATQELAAARKYLESMLGA